MGLSRNGEPRGPDNLPKDRKVGSSNLETWKLWEKTILILSWKILEILFYFIGATLWAIFHAESDDSPVDLGTSLEHFLVVAIAIEQCLAYICNQSSNKA
jgi:hypothetical protein